MAAFSTRMANLSLQMHKERPSMKRLIGSVVLVLAPGNRIWTTRGRGWLAREGGESTGDQDKRISSNPIALPCSVTLAFRPRPLQPKPNPNRKRTPNLFVRRLLFSARAETSTRVPDLLRIRAIDRRAGAPGMIFKHAAARAEPDPQSFCYDLGIHHPGLRTSQAAVGPAHRVHTRQLNLVRRDR